MRAVNLLSEKQIRAAKPLEKSYKLADGSGLYLYVSPTGGKSWRYDYRFAGKRKTLTYGSYPHVPLKLARDRHASARQLLSEGIDPAAQKQLDKRQDALKKQQSELTFEVVARDWYQTQQSANAERTRTSILGRMNLHILPAIGKIPFSDITFENFRDIVRNLETHGKYEMARRVANIITQICRHAKLNQWAEFNKAEDLTRILQKRPLDDKKGLPAITDKDGVATMLRRIHTYVSANKSSTYMQAALCLYPLTVQRAQELVMATWDEIDFDNTVWHCPAKHMKGNKAHDIPLSRQALNILQELKNFRTSNPHIFPSGSKLGHITGESVNKAMHLAGIPKGQMCLHGWRKVFSTLAHEAGAPTMLIEKSLAHVSGDDVARAYDKSRHIEARRVLLQWWADYLDSLRDGTEPPRLELERTAMFA